ncbi:MAG: PHB depolymerase family esterase [Mitsuaria chitosanitabida]|uniref:extracellular catalytic domain type 1 short-chain-length polyhydroxyalkanoate depolymerase n=1 Tax=Roseateles chitosanitabidus TaxID=65048 RepID=UPI001B240EB7|nr:PHB depolymerase family esterase [Roseateles chitosanitabidus]MBO9689087.1 PHB depolymerase family esterase [Roseateles chitosanitabidus]
MTTELSRADNGSAPRDPPSLVAVDLATGAIDPAHRPPEPDDASERFVSGTHVRGQATVRYKLYIPAGDVRIARPLLLMLHGGELGLDDFAVSSQMNLAARRLGWMVLYPEGLTRQGEPAGWSWYMYRHQQRGRGEPAQLASLIRGVMAQHQVDRQRVHVAGLSAGGAMAAVLGQTYPDLFASVGVHSGLPYGAVDDASGVPSLKRYGRPDPDTLIERPLRHRARPTIVFHGTRDMTVHPSNGVRLYEDAVAGLAGEHRFENGREGGRAYTRRTHVGPDGHTNAELWLIEGAGHAWSGGDTQGSQADWQGPAASDQMLCFFMNHPATH